MNQKEFLTIVELRNNARIKLSALSLRLNMPLTTSFDLLRRMNYIQKFTVLINYNALNCPIHIFAHIVLKNNTKDLAKKFTSQNKDINTCFVTNNSDLFIEAIFSNFNELEVFLEEISIFTRSKKVFFITKKIFLEKIFTKSTDTNLL